MLGSGAADGATIYPDCTSRLAIAPPGICLQNVLKNMPLATNPTTGEVYVAGTLTLGVGRLNAATGAYNVYTLPTYPAYDGFLTKELHHDFVHNRLWILGKDSNHAQIWVMNPGTGAILGSRNLTPGAGLFPLGPASGPSPVMAGTVDPASGHFFLLIENAGELRYLSELDFFGGAVNLIRDRDVLFSNPGQHAHGLEWSAALGSLVMISSTSTTSYLTHVKPVGGSPPSVSACTLSARFSALAAGAGAESYVGMKNKIQRATMNSGSTCNVSFTAAVSSSSGNPASPLNTMTDMAYSNGKLAVLYSRDEGQDTAWSNGTQSGVYTQFSTTTPYASWVDVYNVSATGANLNATYSLNHGNEQAMSEAEHIVKQSFAGATSDFEVGVGGAARVAHVPSVPAAGITSHQVGTSAEFGLLSRIDTTKKLVLARLGGSRLFVQSTTGGPGGTLHSAGIVGPWPVGLVEHSSRDELYILDHFTKELRIFTGSAFTSAAADEAAGALSSTLSLSVPKEQTLAGDVSADVQISDTLSELASSGDVHAALLNEVGELHIIDCRSSPCSVSFGEDILPRMVDGGPGRMMAAVDVAPPGYVTVFVYVSVDPKKANHRTVRRYSNQSGSYRLDSTLDLDDPTGCLYPPTAAAQEMGMMSMAAGPGRLYLWDAVLSHGTAVAPPACLRTIADGTSASVLHRVRYVEATGNLWGTYHDMSGATPIETLRNVLWDGSSAYSIDYEGDLFQNRQIKTPFDMKTVTIDIGWQELQLRYGLFANPAEDVVEYHVGL